MKLDTLLNIEMGDQEKKLRTIALQNFTRSTGTLTNLLNATEVSPVVALEAKKLWGKVTECWDKLQSAHDNYLEVVDLDDLETDQDGFPYLDGPTVTHDDLLTKYMKFCIDAKNAEKQDLVTAEDKKRKAEEAERKKIQSDCIETERYTSQGDMVDRFVRYRKIYFTTNKNTTTSSFPSSSSEGETAPTNTKTSLRTNKTNKNDKLNGEWNMTLEECDIGGTFQVKEEPEDNYFLASFVDPSHPTMVQVLINF